MADLLFAPTPHEDAVDFIRSKAPVSRAVFNELLPELRARAFCVTGIEDANVLQRCRDRISDLPAGARWDDVKKDIVGEISPFLVDEDAEPEERDRQITSANRRAELLLRTHGFQAYQSAAYEVADRQRDTHPYWQYMTMEDANVRPSHAALDGIILPADSTFWRDHYPPWDWGCRCQVVPISQDDFEDAQKADAKLPDDDHMILDDARQRELEQNGRLVRGPNQITNCKSPSAMGKPNPFQWHPGDLRLPVEQLEARYSAGVWTVFKAAASKVQIPGKGQTLWAWLQNVGQSKAPPPPGVFATLADAESYLRKHAGIAVISDNLGGLHAAKLGPPLNASDRLRHLQTVADTYHDLLTRFPKMPRALHQFVASSSERGLAAVDGPAPWMAIKAKEWSAAEWAGVHGWENATGGRWGTERQGTQVADNFRHELGHSLSTPDIISKWAAEIEPHLTPDWFAANVSEYARTDSLEAIAESVGLMTRTDYVRGTLPARLESFVFQRILGET